MKNVKNYRIRHKKLKTFIVFLITFLIVLSQTVTAFAGVLLFEPAKKGFADIAVYDEKGKPMVPFKQVFQSFGAVVGWSEKTRTSSAVNKNFVVSVQIGERTAVVNGEKVNLSVPAAIIYSKTYVPLDFVTSLKGVVASGNIKNNLKIWDGDVFIKNHGWTQLSDGLIAHAGGGIYATVNGKQVAQTYTNSMEAIENSYKNGHRVFEIDFNLTYDGRLAAVHEWANVGGKKTSREWATYKINGMYNALFLEDIYKFMLKYKDAFLVTDTKSFHHTDENIKKQFDYLTDAAKSMDESLLKRVIPQVYDQNCYKIMMESYPFDSVIYTLYQSPDSNKEVVNFVAKHDNIKVVTMSWDRYTKDFYNDLNKSSKYIYFFTINVIKEMETFKKWGVYGFYTDFIKPK